jgi:hypothetical protein
MGAVLHAGRGQRRQCGNAAIILKTRPSALSIPMRGCSDIASRRKRRGDRARHAGLFWFGSGARLA